MKIRAARRSDKENVLSFCTNTFSWGDYIDQVWDIWYHDRSGRLFVTESDKAIAVSHVAVCPDKKSIWLEGIRVNPRYRRAKIATNLIRTMLQYGRKYQAKEASAIVAVDNLASQKMMEKCGFKVISKWVYYAAGGRIKHHQSDARIATARDLKASWKYLSKSKIYRLSGKRYVKSWQWYTLDRKSLTGFIKEKRLVVAGNPVDGIAVINKRGYWKRTNVLQVVYLDSSAKSSLDNLISFVTNLYLDEKFDRLQFVCHKNLAPAIKKFKISRSEQFLLYSKKI